MGSEIGFESADRSDLEWERNAKGTQILTRATGRTEPPPPWPSHLAAAMACLHGDATVCKRQAGRYWHVTYTLRTYWHLTYSHDTG